MVTMQLSCLAQAHAQTYGGTDGVFRGLDGLGHVQYPGLVLLGNHYDTIGVAAHEIARRNADPADIDRNLGRFYLNPVLAGAHVVPEL